MFEQYQPTPLLPLWIACFWAVNAQAPYRREKIIPLGVIDLMFNFGSSHRVIDRQNDENKGEQHGCYDCNEHLSSWQSRC